MEFLGDPFFSRDVQGNLKSRIGTMFLHTPGVVTLKGIHATQRMAWIEYLSKKRVSQSLPPLNDFESEIELSESVDLLMNDQFILIRADPNRMDLAFRCDEMLQTLVSKREIRFLNVIHEKVRQALRGRGEYWRMSPLPRSPLEIERLIVEGRTAIGGQAIYYYNKDTGTRFLTCDEFCKLANFDDDTLHMHLVEIQRNLQQRNRFGYPEVAYFPSGCRWQDDSFRKAQLERMSKKELRASLQKWSNAFSDAIAPELRRDRITNTTWRNTMFKALTQQPNATLTADIVEGLSPEFFLQVEWLPGARVDGNILMFDPVLDELREAQHNRAATENIYNNMYDIRARGFIMNYMREFSDIEYINIGRVGRSLSKRATDARRSAVYITEVKAARDATPRVRIIRIQKWGIAEHLDNGKPLLQAILDAEEYADYILDRRLGCRQLGMSLPEHVSGRRISEFYKGSNHEHHGRTIWTSYIERDYICGYASDKLPVQCYADPEFNRRLARLLGSAAAANLVIGRTSSTTNEILFDDGDEVIVRDAEELPAQLVVSDHTGAFNDYLSPLVGRCAAYAQPVLKRSKLMPNLNEFSNIYINAFKERLEQIRSRYLSNKKVFDTLFIHLKRDEAGSFAFRWECVLKRLAQADPEKLARAIQDCL